jgi:hypothetical protein
MSVIYRSNKGKELLSNTYGRSGPLAFLSIYGSTALLLELRRYSVFLSPTQSIGLLGRGISPSQGRYLLTLDITNTE